MSFQRRASRPHPRPLSRLRGRGEHKRAFSTFCVPRAPYGAGLKPPTAGAPKIGRTACSPSTSCSENGPGIVGTALRGRGLSTIVEAVRPSRAGTPDVTAKASHPELQQTIRARRKHSRRPLPATEGRAHTGSARVTVSELFSFHRWLSPTAIPDSERAVVHGAVPGAEND